MQLDMNLESRNTLALVLQYVAEKQHIHILTIQVLYPLVHLTLTTTRTDCCIVLRNTFKRLQFLQTKQNMQT